MKGRTSWRTLSSPHSSTMWRVCRTNLTVCHSTSRRFRATTYGYSTIVGTICYGRSGHCSTHSSSYTRSFSSHSNGRTNLTRVTLWSRTSIYGRFCTTSWGFSDSWNYRCAQASRLYECGRRRGSTRFAAVSRTVTGVLTGGYAVTCCSFNVTMSSTCWSHATILSDVA